MCTSTCGEPDFWQRRFTARDGLETAAQVADVYCRDVLDLVLNQPGLSGDQLAHITLRLVQPPGTFRRGHVGYLVLGDHTRAIAHLAGHSTLGAALVALARTWEGTPAELATAAAGIVAAPADRRGRLEPGDGLVSGARPAPGGGVDQTEA